MRKKGLIIALVLAALVVLIGVVPASATSSKGSIVYIVQRGDTLYSIARRYGVDVWTIASYNGITNPNRIYVGQRLVIPAAQPVRTGTVHVVRPGETLLRIAMRYGVNAWAIARANGITNLNYIYVGQRLVIPRVGRHVPPQPQPVQPTTWPGPWSAEYFDNVALDGSAYVTREDGNISFDWAWGPPAGGMPTNNFSVRWTGTFYFDEGTYRFYTRIDDGVRVYVDDELIIDSWRDGGFRLYSKDRAMWAGDHTVRVEYYERTQVSKVYFWWKALSGAAATPSPGATVTPVPGAAWTAKFFNGEGVSGDPVVTRTDSWIGFDWGAGSPADGVWPDHFSARWTTTARLQTDHYRFCARSDDGVMIWVGNTLVVDQWHANNGNTYCTSQWFATGNYAIKVEYYEDGGKALIYVWWEPH